MARADEGMTGDEAYQELVRIGKHEKIAFAREIDTHTDKIEDLEKRLDALEKTVEDLGKDLIKSDRRFDKLETVCEKEFKNK